MRADLLRLCETTPAGPENIGVLHAFFRKLPQNMDLDALIATSVRLFQTHPPPRVLSTVKDAVARRFPKGSPYTVSDVKQAIKTPPKYHSTKRHAYDLF